MTKEDYKLYKWYPVTDDTYWAEDYPEEFPNCQTIVCCTRPEIDNTLRTMSTSFLGWGTMAKYGEWQFMIVEKPVQIVKES